MSSTVLQREFAYNNKENNNHSPHNLILSIQNAFKKEMIQCQHERKNPLLFTQY